MVLPQSICSEDGLTFCLMKNNPPQVPAQRGGGFGQANLRQATTGEELLPQGESSLLTSWPPEWWRGAGVTTAEREGGPLLGVLF